MMLFKRHIYFSTRIPRCCWVIHYFQWWNGEVSCVGLHFILGGKPANSWFTELEKKIILQSVISRGYWPPTRPCAWPCLIALQRHQREKNELKLGDSIIQTHSIICPIGGWVAFRRDYLQKLNILFMNLFSLSQCIITLNQIWIKLYINKSLCFPSLGWALYQHTEQVQPCYVQSSNRMLNN